MKSVLDKRLTAAAEAVVGTVLADIGTDHGKLPVSLLVSGKIEKAFACDINTGPLGYAEELIKENGLSEKAETVLTDGLERLPLSEITDITVCGMGGELISAILEKSLCTEYYHINFILNPMSRDEVLRRWLCDNGFSVKTEKAVVQSGKVYTVMSVQYTGKPREPDGIYCYIGNFSGKTPEEKAYIDKVLKRLIKQSRADKSVLPIIEKAEELLR